VVADVLLSDLPPRPGECDWIWHDAETLVRYAEEVQGTNAWRFWWD